MDKRLKDLSSYRLQKSRDELESSEIMLNNGN